MSSGSVCATIVMSKSFCLKTSSIHLAGNSVGTIVISTPTSDSMAATSSADRLA